MPNKGNNNPLQLLIPKVAFTSILGSIEVIIEVMVEIIVFRRTSLN